MCVFSSIYNSSNNIRASNSGKKVRNNYKPVYSAAGVYNLVPDGVINSYDDIQSHAESCDLKLIIEKYNMTGDRRLLDVKQGFFEDISNFPENFADLQNKIIDANMQFMELPLEIREKFSHNPVEFYTEFGTKEFFEKVGVKRKSKEESIEDMVKEGEFVADEQESK